MWIEDQLSSSAGTQSYKLWIPASYNSAAPVPLLMMLHGCTQSPDDFAAGTQMNVLADEYNFLVVYPEQTGNSNELKCWNWFLPEHQSRGAGEPAKLAAVVEHLRDTYSVDAARTFIAGMSAGGAMAVIMGVTYPDLFAAIGVHSGLAYQAAVDLPGALKAQQSGSPDPTHLGLAAFKAMGKASSESRRRIRVIVFHGTDDARVHPNNADQIIMQWAWTNAYVEGLRDNALGSGKSARLRQETVPDGYRYTRKIYTDGHGGTLLEKWIVQGLGHAWSGGSGEGSHTDPNGPKASEAIWKFFSETD